VQREALKTVAGLEKAFVTRLGYAIEYDFFPPTQLKHSLETRKIENLFFAGQINGTSGYEEAAAQGLLAGINAVLKLRSEPPFIPDRAEAYMGVLIDDLVIKGTGEPYRLFTSRAEYRLLLRQDNADRRLLKYGVCLGLVDPARMKRLDKKEAAIEAVKRKIRRLKPDPKQVNPMLFSAGTTPLAERQSVYQLLKRPQITLALLSKEPLVCALIRDLGDLEKEVVEQVEIEVKYEGYFQRQEEQVKRFRKLESRKIPDDFDYESIKALSKEAREKLTRQKPVSLGQAARISGVSPSDISVLAVWLEKEKR
jgi:tRNA uridine 5-carboxymethylaminomethyl modification enzyme